MKRQRVDWFGEQTRDDQAFIFGLTDTRLAINDLQMSHSILFTGRTDDRPIVDCSCVGSTCPKRCEAEVQMVVPEQQLNELNVLCEPLRHEGTRSCVKFPAADHCEMRENFEVDATLER